MASSLPLLLAHGPVVGALMLAGFVALCFAVFWAAIGHRIARRRTRAAWGVVAIVATGVLGWRILSDFTAYQHRACLEDTGATPGREFDDAPFLLDNTHACALAALAPGDQGDTLLAGLVIEHHASYDERVMRQLIELGQQRSCAVGVAMMMRFERFDDALTEARRCGDLRGQHHALLHLGRFAEASLMAAPEQPNPARRRSFEPELLPALPLIPTLVAAGRWDAAAAAVDALAADALRLSPSADDVQRRQAGHTAMYDRCLGELMRYRGGDVAAADRLRALAAGPLGLNCNPMLYELTRDPQLLDPALLSETMSTADEVAVYQRWIDGIREPEWLPDTPWAVLLHGEYGPVGPTYAPWLAKLAPRAPLRPLVHAWRAVEQVLAGAPTDAATTARLVVSLTASRGDFAELPALIALRTPSTRVYAARYNDVGWDPGPGPDSEEAYPQVKWRHGEKSRHPDRRYFWDPDRAAAGDGDELAHLPRAGSEPRDVDVMAVLPRVTRHRDALIRSLVWSPAGDLEHDDAPDFLLRLAYRAANRRDVLRLAGDPAADQLAQQWAEIYQRVDAVLGDRAKLMALIMLHDGWSQH